MAALVPVVGGQPPVIPPPPIQQGNDGNDPPLVEVHPIRRLGEALLAKWNKPATMIPFGQVVFVPVPGGLAIRLDRVGLPLEAEINQIPGLALTKRDIDFRAFKRELVVPLDQLAALVAFSGLPADVVDAIKGSSPVFTDYMIHTAYDSKDRCFRPAHTIALSLARLDSDQPEIKKFTNAYFEPEQFGGSKIPLLLGTDEGFEIRLPVGMSVDFVDLLQKTFRLKANPENYTHCFTLIDKSTKQVEYGTLIKIERDNVDDFLQLMGFNDVANVRRLDPTLTPLINEVKDHLKSLGKHYEYQPAIVRDNPIATIEQSLSKLLRQSRDRSVTPLVTLHPLRGLIIRLPDNQEPDNYVNRLTDFLGFGSHPISYEKDGVTFTWEIVIPIDKMTDFLTKPMHLDQLAQSLPATVEGWRDKIGGLSGQKENVVQPDGSRQSEARVANTISRRLAALFSVEAADQLRGYNPIGTPEKVLPLPRLEFAQGEATIYLPRIMTSPKARFLPGLVQWLGFVPALVEDVAETQKKRERLGDLLGITFEECEHIFTDSPQVYTSKVVVPYADLLVLMERGLGMRDLPANTLKPFQRETYRNELDFGFGKTLGVPFLPHGTVNPEGLKLLPPRITVPDPLPQYTIREMAKLFEDTLTEGRVVRPMRYSSQLSAVLNAIRDADPNQHTLQTLLNAFRHFAYELQKVPSKVPLHVKVQSLISIAETSILCFPGTQVRVVEETKRVAGQDDNARNIIAGFWEEFKNTVLFAEIFRDYDQNVHAFALAQDEWGEEFGLDRLAGRRDPVRERYGRIVLTQQNRDRFRAICNDHRRAIEGMTTTINSRRDECNAVQSLSAFESALRQILIKRGFDNRGVDQELERLLPVDPVTSAVSVSSEAVKLLMIDAGILNP